MQLDLDSRKTVTFSVVLETASGDLILVVIFIHSNHCISMHIMYFRSFVYFLLCQGQVWPTLAS